MTDINLGVGAANSASDSVYEVSNSLKLEADNSEYLHFTPSSQTDYERMAFSVWIKRTELGTTQTIAEFGNGTANTTNLRIGFDTNDKLFIYGNSIVYRESTQVFRDTNAWYHLFFLFDTTQGTSNDRVRVWLNGSMIAHSDFGTVNNPGSGTAMGFNKAIQQSLGAQREDGPKNYFCGYIAQAYGSGGTPPVVGDFGEYDDNGIWIPKDISSLTPPDTNGFNLDFSSSGSLGNDISSRNNDFTLVNIAAADQATDTPTNNFCTPILIQPYNSTDSISHTEGGTKLTTASGTGWRTNMATVSLSSGKWYFEAKHPGTIDGDAIMTSIVPTARFGNSAYASFYGGQSSGDGIGFYWDSTRFRYDDGSTISPPTNTISSGDILSIALDMDNNYVYSRINGGSWHNNGSANGDPTSGSSGTGGFAVADEPHMICTSMYHPIKNFFVNFGGYNAFPVSSAASDANGYGTFEYAPPSGYYAICTKNLAEYG